MAKQGQWVKSTGANSGTGRHCKADRMAWVYNVTEFHMARQLEDDAMLAIRNVFNFIINLDPSIIHRKSVSATKPHAGHFMAIRPYTGTIEQFLDRKDAIKGDPSIGQVADGQLPILK